MSSWSSEQKGEDQLKVLQRDGSRVQVTVQFVQVMDRLNWLRWWDEYGHWKGGEEDESS